MIVRLFIIQTELVYFVSLVADVIVSLLGDTNRTINESNGFVQLCIEAEGEIDRNFTIFMTSIPKTGIGKQSVIPALPCYCIVIDITATSSDVQYALCVIVTPPTHVQ